MKQSFPTLTAYILGPGCCAAAVVGEHGFMYKMPCSLVDLCSWNFHPHAMYIHEKSIKIYGNVGNIIQFSVFMAHFLPPQNSLTPRFYFRAHFLQPLVYLSQTPDFSEALKNTF
jgi:hypothetical protein